MYSNYLINKHNIKIYVNWVLFIGVKQPNLEKKILH